MSSEERKSYIHANAWWIITAVWAWAYVLASIFDHTWLDSLRAGAWLALLDTFSIGAIGCVSTATLAVDYRTRQKAVNDDVE